MRETAGDAMRETAGDAVGETAGDAMGETLRRATREGPRDPRGNGWLAPPALFRGKTTR
jgi:hypothetical protein